MAIQLYLQQQHRQVKIGTPYETKRGTTKVPLYDAVTGDGIKGVTAVSVAIAAAQA